MRLSWRRARTDPTGQAPGVGYAVAELEPALTPPPDPTAAGFFDLDNTMNADELYALLNQENLIETLRADGYDAVVLNFLDATDYLQRNSLLLVELLQQIQGIAGPQTTVGLAGLAYGR